MRMRVLVAAVCLWGAACTVPAQTGPQPAGPGYGAPGSGQPAYGQTTAGASCQQNLQCYGACNAEPCLAACDAQTTPETVSASRAVLNCSIRNQCADADCVARGCGAEVSQCNGTQPSVATAPTQAPPPPAGNQSIGVAQLVGHWDHTQASTQDFVNSSTGEFVGTSVTAYGESYEIGADGTINYLFAGVSGGNRVRSVEKGSVSFGNGFLLVTFPDRRVDAVAERRVMSYFATTDGTTILVTVPAHTTQSGVNWDDPAYVANFCGPPGKRIESCVGGETWIRPHSR